MSEQWDVMGFGALAVDDLLYVDHFPLANSKTHVRARQRQGGGLCATALVAAARLGAKAAYTGVLGPDELSRFAVEELEGEGVDCSAVLYRPEARPIHSVIIVDRSTATRNVFSYSLEMIPRQPDEVDEALIGRCRVLLVDHKAVAGGVRGAQLARKLGIPVVGDIEDETVPGVQELMALTDHLIVGHEFAGRVTGETDCAAMVRALAGGRACCVVTAGERGCWYKERGDEAVYHYPAMPVKAVDTTGCGDVFHGAYAAALAMGGGVRRAIAVATATAGIKTTRPGGRSGIPDWATVERFLREHAPD
ncbi:MAG: permease [Chloroflexi bacterium]|jgi:sugar/nucleoside kinase (ribokinase family)|nr:permease [Chloroflexota bacterium]